MTKNNVDPECEYRNKTKHNENLWVNDHAENAFMRWFE